MRPIDADALFEVIKKSMAENPHKEEMQRAMHIHEHKYFLTLLTSFQTIQPEQKRGWWICGKDEYGIDGYYCDKCGFFVPCDYALEDYKFCPNCGADMRGEKDG